MNFCITYVPPTNAITRPVTGENEPVSAAAGADGSVWLIIGTDSGFEGTTSIFYDNVQLTFTP